MSDLKCKKQRKAVNPHISDAGTSPSFAWFCFDHYNCCWLFFSEDDQQIFQIIISAILNYLYCLSVCKKWTTITVSSTYWFSLKITIFMHKKQWIHAVTSIWTVTIFKRKKNIQLCFNHRPIPYEMVYYYIIQLTQQTCNNAKEPIHLDVYTFESSSSSPPEPNVIWASFVYVSKFLELR